MKIVVDHIKDIPLTLHFDEPLAVFPLLVGMQGNNECSITGNVSGDLTVAREYENLRVAGRVSVPLSLCCSRCLVEYSSFIDTNFTLFLRKEAVSPAAGEYELELGELDVLSSVYSGDEVDLTHEIEEQVAMEIPLKPLCSESCKGLCHECGVDLNATSCKCSKKSVSLAFNVLKDFKVVAK